MIPACPIVVFHLALTYSTTTDRTLTSTDPWMVLLKPFLRHFEIKMPGHARRFQDLTHNWLQGGTSRGYAEAAFRESLPRPGASAETFLHIKGEASLSPLIQAAHISQVVLSSEIRTQMYFFFSSMGK